MPFQNTERALASHFMSGHQILGIPCDLGHKFTLVWFKKLSTIFSLHKTGIQNNQTFTQTTIKQLHQALRSMFAAQGALQKKNNV
jgi:hypothetical protein